MMGRSFPPASSSSSKRRNNAGLAPRRPASRAIAAPTRLFRSVRLGRSGKGTEVGRTFEELARIIGGVEARRPELAGADVLGVCLDTCHISDGGYDIVHDLDGVMAEFDRVVGSDRLRAVHINDSKNPCGAHKDRHEVIGGGYLGNPELGGGEHVLRAIVTHPALRDLPFILETPHDDLAGYAGEIAYLRGLAG